jgi:hypothetical protein
MEKLETQVSVLRRRVVLRQVSVGALYGLLGALLVLILLPWLGLPRGLVYLLPVVLPVLGAAVAWVRRPDDGTTVLAVDRWAGANGVLASAWEQRAGTGMFRDALAVRALACLGRVRVPVPRHVRWALAAMLVLGAMLPLSRAVEAQRVRHAQQQYNEQLAGQTDVQPEDAAAIAEDAEDVQRQAQELGTRRIERLATDVAELARRIEAAPRNKDRALREADALLDRTRGNLRQVADRTAARAALANEPMTAELARALESVDPDARERALQELAECMWDGEEQDFQAALNAIRQASEAAPHDTELRRAAGRLSELAGPEARHMREARRERMLEQMLERGLSEAEIEAALEQLERMDQEALLRALQEFAASMDKLRHFGLGGAHADDPEQARRLLEQAQGMLERLDLDAEALAEMLRQGGAFEGLEELLRARHGGAECSGGPSAPSWSPSRGQGGEPDDGARPTGDGQDDSRAAEMTDFTELHAPETGQGRRPPGDEAIELDPRAAGDETARRAQTGRESTSRGVDTSGDLERLPRRYHGAVRRYFERD